jgi:hypothetical protein
MPRTVIIPQAKNPMRPPRCSITNPAKKLPTGVEPVIEEGKNAHYAGPRYSFTVWTWKNVFDVFRKTRLKNPALATSSMHSA